MHGHHTCCENADPYTCSPRQVQAARSHMHMTVGLQMRHSPSRFRATHASSRMASDSHHENTCILRGASCRADLSSVSPVSCESLCWSALSKTTRYVSPFIMYRERTLLSGHMPKCPSSCTSPCNSSRLLLVLAYRVLRQCFGRQRACCARMYADEASSLLHQLRHPSSIVLGLKRSRLLR
jgi:hypothetical protein